MPILSYLPTKAQIALCHFKKKLKKIGLHIHARKTKFIHLGNSDSQIYFILFLSDKTIATHGGVTYLVIKFALFNFCTCICSER